MRSCSWVILRVSVMSGEEAWEAYYVHGHGLDSCWFLWRLATVKKTGLWGHCFDKAGLGRGCWIQVDMRGRLSWQVINFRSLSLSISKVKVANFLDGPAPILGFGFGISEIIHSIRRVDKEGFKVSDFGPEKRKSIGLHFCTFICPLPNGRRPRDFSFEDHVFRVDIVQMGSFCQ